MAEARTLNMAEAKRHFSEIVHRAAFTVITRRGKPMARLAPLTSASRSLADLHGWLGDDDPLFAAVDAIVEQRQLVWPPEGGRRRLGRTATPQRNDLRSELAGHRSSIRVIYV